jgi:hypothetical protein
MARLDRVIELEQILPVENDGFRSGLEVLSWPGMVNRINGAYQTAPERVYFWRSEKQCQAGSFNMYPAPPQTTAAVSNIGCRGGVFQQNITTR